MYFCLFITEILKFLGHITQAYLKCTYAPCGRLLKFTPGNGIKRNFTAYFVHCLDRYSYGTVESRGNINHDIVHSKQWDFFQGRMTSFNWKISTFTVPSLSTKDTKLIFFLSKLIFFMSKHKILLFISHFSPVKDTLSDTQILISFNHFSTFNKGNSSFSL